MEQCVIESCENTKMKSNAWRGQFYCVDHYGKMVWDEFFMQYEKWEKGEPVHYKFKKILGRAYGEDFFENVSEMELTPADVYDRGINFVKTEGGCEFETTRYFTHEGDYRKTRNAVKKWVVDIESKTFEMVSSRNLGKKDSDLYSEYI